MTECCLKSITDTMFLLINEGKPNENVTAQTFVAPNWENASILWRNTRMQSKWLAPCKAVPINQTWWVSDKVWFLCCLVLLEIVAVFLLQHEALMLLIIKFLLVLPTTNLQQHDHLPLNKHLLGICVLPSCGWIFYLISTTLYKLPKLLEIFK